MEFGMIAGLVVFLLGIILGLHLCWAFLASVVVALILISSPMSFIAGTLYHSVDNYVLMAVAFFVFAGMLMAEAGIADRLLRLSYALVGRVKGGLVDVGIMATLFMAALTGSAIPSLAALIPILVPRLEKFGYMRKYSTAALCSSGFLGHLIPPSIPVLIYCLLSQQSVAAVFLSTVFPGLILAGGYMVLNYFISPKYMLPAREVLKLPATFKESAREVGAATWSALPALGAPIIILGGIYGGIFTPNEAGAVAVIYTLIVGLFIYRGMKWKTVWKSSQFTVVMLGMIVLLLGFGFIFTRLLIREGIGQLVTDFFAGGVQNKFLVLIMINVLMLFMGMFIDGFPIMVIMVPLLIPMLTQLNMNLVQVGAIIVINCGMGQITPPFAASIFWGSRLSGVPYEQLVPPILKFLFVVAIPVLLLTTYIPALSCWLPTMAVGPKIVGPW